MTTINRRVAKLESAQRQQDIERAEKIVALLKNRPDSPEAKRVTELLSIAKARRDRALGEKTL